MVSRRPRRSGGLRRALPRESAFSSSSRTEKSGRGQAVSDGPGISRKPPWFKIRLNTSESYVGIKRLVRAEGLHTVCEEARCPNLHECWGTHGTASFMILGDICTRRCRFCAVGTGLPLAVDLLEPMRVAASV